MRAGSQFASCTCARRIHEFLRYESPRTKWRPLRNHQRCNGFIKSRAHYTLRDCGDRMNRHHNPKRTLKMPSMGFPPLLSQHHPLIAGGIGHLTSLHGNGNCRLLLPLLVSRGIWDPQGLSMETKLCTPAVLLLWWQLVIVVHRCTLEASTCCRAHNEKAACTCACTTLLRWQLTCSYIQVAGTLSIMVLLSCAALCLSGSSNW